MAGTFRKTLTGAVVVAGIALGGVACGGDTPASTTSGTKTAAGGSTTIDTSFTGKGSGDFCTVTKKFTEKFKDQKNASTPSEVKAQFTEITAAINKMASEAPSEIKADANLLKDAFNEANDLYKKYDYDASKFADDPAVNNLKVTSAEVDAANTRLQSYMETVCKIDADEDGDTDGIISSGSSGTAPETTTTSAP